VLFSRSITNSRIDAAVDTVKDAKKNIFCVSHIDADGLTSAGILGKTLHRANISYHIRCVRQLELPIISETKIELLLNSLLDRVDRVLVDRLNIKAGNWKKIKNALQDNYPEVLDNFQLASRKESMYYSRLKGKMRNLFEERMIPVEILY